MTDVVKRQAAYIKVEKYRTGSYLRLRSGRDPVVQLGRYDPNDPTCILAVCVSAASKLKLRELQLLLKCRKDQREPDRPPGRPRKSLRY